MHLLSHQFRPSSETCEPVPFLSQSTTQGFVIGTALATAMAASVRRRSLSNGSGPARARRLSVEARHRFRRLSGHRYARHRLLRVWRGARPPIARAQPLYATRRKRRPSLPPLGSGAMTTLVAGVTASV